MRRIALALVGTLVVAGAGATTAEAARHASESQRREIGRDRPNARDFECSQVLVSTGGRRPPGLSRRRPAGRARGDSCRRLPCGQFLAGAAIGVGGLAFRGGLLDRVGVPCRPLRGGHALRVARNRCARALGLLSPEALGRGVGFDVADRDVGAGTNLGAATITANYDGRDKHRTTIGARVRTGVDTTLVAPVSVGDDAYTGAGSVITEDVEPGALGVARERQRNVAGYAERRRRDSA